MSRRPGRPRKDFVHPHREKLLELRDKYMRDMEAPSYSAVREKFIQEVQSKRSPEEPAQKEWGVGVWNNAFASSGMMQRSSIVLLAEFFGVDPEVLILPMDPQAVAEPSAPAASAAAPAALPSISVNGHHNQVAAAAGDIVIQGSIIQAAALVLPEDMP